jgi:hypothetical protein
MAFSSAFSQAVPFCELRSHPEKYLGREISVGGIYGLTPHQRILYDPSCAGELEVQLSDDDANLRMDGRLFRKFRAKHRKDSKVVYRGYLDRESAIGVCLGPDCFRYILRRSTLVTTDASLGNIG